MRRMGHSGRVRALDALRRLHADTRGGSASEHVMLVGLVTLLAALTLVAIGPKLVEGYQSTRTQVASPYP